MLFRGLWNWFVERVWKGLELPVEKPWIAISRASWVVLLGAQDQNADKNMDSKCQAQEALVEKNSSGNWIRGPVCVTF